MRDPAGDPREQEEALERAIHCFDLNAIASTIANDAGLESVFRLREILDRLTLPTPEEIPGKDEIKKQQLTP